MGALKQKLKSERGASILLALLFFLLCAMVGGSILFSASSNAGRLSHIRDEQAAYLSVSSAAKLLREELGELSFRGIKETVTEDGVETESNNSFVLVSDETSISALVQEMAEDIYLEEYARVPNEAAFNIVPDVGISELKEVEVKLVMSEDSADKYSLYAEISLPDGDKRYSMTLDIPATVKTSTHTSTEEYTETNSDGEEEIKVRKTVTITTTVVFGKGMLAKAKEDAS